MDDNELLRALAKGTGWSVCPKNGPYELCYAPEEWCAFFQTEADAWHYAEASVKDAPESVDAALALPWPEHCTLTIDWFQAGGAEVLLGYWLTDHTEEINRSSPTLARALCEVFAAWAGAQEAKEGEKAHEPRR